MKTDLGTPIFVHDIFYVGHDEQGVINRTNQYEQMNGEQNEIHAYPVSDTIVISCYEEDVTTVFTAAQAAIGVARACEVLKYEICEMCPTLNDCKDPKSSSARQKQHAGLS